MTDEGNYILDCAFGRIDDPAALAARLDAMPGVVDHGLFVGLADTVVVGRGDGTVVIEREWQQAESECAQPATVVAMLAERGFRSVPATAAPESQCDRDLFTSSDLIPDCEAEPFWEPFLCLPRNR